MNLDDKPDQERGQPNQNNHSEGSGVPNQGTPKGHNFLVVAEDHVAGLFDDIEKAKAKLMRVRTTSRMIAEVDSSGALKRDPHRVGGYNQTPEEGFNKFWYDWWDINRMMDVAQQYIDGKKGRGSKGQHSALRGGPPRSWTNDDLTKALENVWNKRMTTSQASRVFGIPYNSLLMYVRGKYGKSLRLDVIKKTMPATNDNLNTIGNSRSTPKEKANGNTQREGTPKLGRPRKPSHDTIGAGGIFPFDQPGMNPFGNGLLNFSSGLPEHNTLGLLGLAGLPPGEINEDNDITEEMANIAIDEPEDENEDEDDFVSVQGGVRPQDPPRVATLLGFARADTVTVNDLMNSVINHSLETNATIVRPINLPSDNK